MSMGAECWALFFYVLFGCFSKCYFRAFGCHSEAFGYPFQLILGCVSKFWLSIFGGEIVLLCRRELKNQCLEITNIAQK